MPSCLHETLSTLIQITRMWRGTNVLPGNRRPKRGSPRFCHGSFVDPKRWKKTCQVLQQHQKTRLAQWRSFDYSEMKDIDKCCASCCCSSSYSFVLLLVLLLLLFVLFQDTFFQFLLLFLFFLLSLWLLLLMLVLSFWIFWIYGVRVPRFPHVLKASWI